MRLPFPLPSSATRRGCAALDPDAAHREDGPVRTGRAKKRSRGGCPISSRPVSAHFPPSRDQVPELDYYRAEVLQEQILAESSVPYSIVRATQFMEFMDAAMSWTSDGDTVRLPATPIQPIAAKDVTAEVAAVAVGAPLNGVRNIGGPDVFTLDKLGQAHAGPEGRQSYRRHRPHRGYVRGGQGRRPHRQERPPRPHALHRLALLTPCQGRPIPDVTHAG